MIRTVFLFLINTKKSCSSDKTTAASLLISLTRLRYQYHFSRWMRKISAIQFVPQRWTLALLVWPVRQKPWYVRHRQVKGHRRGFPFCTAPTWTWNYFLIEAGEKMLSLITLSSSHSGVLLLFYIQLQVTGYEAPRLVDQGRALDRATRRRT